VGLTAQQAKIQVLFGELNIKTDQAEADEESFIDKFSLDDVCASQGRLYIKWSRKYAKAAKLKELCLSELELEKAWLELEIRKDPKKYGIEPDNKGIIKEGAVKAVIRLDNTVQELESDFIQANFLRRRYRGIRDGFDQRKVMIREEGDLYLGEYYSRTEIKQASASDFRKKTGQGRGRGRN